MRLPENTIHIGYCAFMRAGRVFSGEIDPHADPNITVGDAVKIAASITGAKYDEQLTHALYAYAELGLGSIAYITDGCEGYISLPVLSIGPEGAETLDVHARPETGAVANETDVLAHLREMAQTNPVSDPYQASADMDAWNAERRRIVAENTRRWHEANERLARSAIHKVPSREIGAAVRPHLRDAAHAIGIIRAIGLFSAIYGFAAEVLNQNGARGTCRMDGMRMTLNEGERELGAWIFGIETRPSEGREVRGVKKVLEGPALRWAHHLFRRKGKLTELTMHSEKDATGQPRITRLGTRVDNSEP